LWKEQMWDMDYDKPLFRFDIGSQVTFTQISREYRERESGVWGLGVTFITKGYSSRSDEGSWHSLCWNLGCLGGGGEGGAVGGHIGKIYPHHRHNMGGGQRGVVFLL
jgi:hypothetical protein